LTRLIREKYFRRHPVSYRSTQGANVVQYSNFLRIFLLVSIIATLPTAALARGHQCFLKINNYYVLYTYPCIPSVDRNGEATVGLDGLAAMLRSHVKYGVHTAKLVAGKHSFVFSDKSSDVVLDGKKIKMRFAARTLSTTDENTSHKWLVPCSVFYKPFHVKHSWNKAGHILQLQSPILTRTIDQSDFFGEVQGEEAPMATKPSLSPVSIVLHTGLPPTYSATTPSVAKGYKWLEFSVKNNSSRLIKSNKAYVNVYIGPEGNMINLPFPYDVAPPNPELRAGETRRLDIRLNAAPPSLFAVGWLVVKR